MQADGTFQNVIFQTLRQSRKNTLYTNARIGLNLLHFSFMCVRLVYNINYIWSYFVVLAESRVDGVPSEGGVRLPVPVQPRLRPPPDAEVG